MFTIPRDQKTAHALIVIGFLMTTAVLSGCEGSDGATGPPGPPAGVDIANATSIVAIIDSARVDDQVVVEFALADDNGNPVKGLPADAAGFKLAKLIPGTDGNNSAWQSYINVIEEPGVGPGTEAAVQANTENGASGELTDNNDGTYTYRFALDIGNITEPLAVAYDPALTHRVALEIRGYEPVINPHFDWRPADNATEGLFTRAIAATETCNACHEQLALHGGARFTMEDCVTCHNPGSTDANSGNTVDMTVMTHKIHRGSSLPSVEAGGDYCIYGFRDTEYCYNDVVHPQDIRNCSTCHDAANPATPDASNWYTQPTDKACGACHDDVDFTTGANHGSGIVADNSQCISCHASNPDSRIEVRQAHRIPEVERAAEYSFNLLNINYVPGSAPVVTFSITDPTNNDQPYDLQNNPELTSSSPRFYLAWNTVDYFNAGNGIDNAQPARTDIYDDGTLLATPNGDMTYSMPLTMIPGGITGSGVVTFEGNVQTDVGRAPVTTTFRYFGITDDPANPVPRRTSVDIARCNDCHELTSFHGANRNDSIESCQTCHVADAARSGSPSEGPMDMKHFLHRIHAVDEIRYPQRASNCIACHTDDGFYPVAIDSGVLATSSDRGNSEASPTDNNRVSPNTSACGVCHATTEATVHMTQNGGSTDACQEADGSLLERVNFCGPGGNKNGAPVTESCNVCHGPGRVADVATVHQLEL